MRVLILAQHLAHALGGIEIQCDLIARGLVALGHDVVYGAVGRLPNPASVPYALAAWQPRDAASLRALVAAHRPDVIYFRHNKHHLRTTARAAASLRVPLVFAVSSLQDVQPWSYHRKHVPWTPRRIASVAWQRMRSRWNYGGFRDVAAVVSLNPDYTDRVPVERRATILDAMPHAAAPFPWPRPFVAWVAQLKDYKNPAAFVDLARRCRDLAVDFVMVGACTNPRHEWIAAARGTPPNFHYLGPLSPFDVNGVLRASQLLVHTCDPEGFGNNFIQAWHQGRPTLSLYFDPAGIIEREQLGAVPGSIDGLERALRDWLADDARRSAAGERARAYARREHDPATNVAQLAGFLRATVESSRTRNAPA